MKKLKIYDGMTGKTTTDNGSLDYNLKAHTGTFKPPYKSFYYDQKATSKRLLQVASILAAILFIGVTGSYYRMKHLGNKLTVMEGLYISATIESDDRRKIIDGKDTLIASLSAEVKMSKLSDKARIHMKQHPEVVEAIKLTFGDEWVEAIELFSRESSLMVDTVNESSGACGIVQFLPCSKLVKVCTLSDLSCQLSEGKKYIESRYGSVQAALNHSFMKNWY